MQVIDIVSLMKAFCHLHRLAGQPMDPIYAGTVAALLGQCEEHLVDIERGRAAQAHVHAAADENIIHVNFNRSAPPSDGGDAA